MPLVFNTELPLAMLLAVSFLIGFMVGSLWTAWMLRRPAAHKTSGRSASGKGASGKGSGTKAPPATAPSSTEPADRPPDPHLP
ncbi:LapA family protein [Roseiconus nitratireducens]